MNFSLVKTKFSRFLIVATIIVGFAVSSIWGAKESLPKSPGRAVRCLSWVGQKLQRVADRIENRCSPAVQRVVERVSDSIANSRICGWLAKKLLKPEENAKNQRLYAIYGAPKYGVAALIPDGLAVATHSGNRSEESKEWKPKVVVTKEKIKRGEIKSALVRKKSSRLIRPSGSNVKKILLVGLLLLATVASAYQQTFLTRDEFAQSRRLRPKSCAYRPLHETEYVCERYNETRASSNFAQQMCSPGVLSEPGLTHRLYDLDCPVRITHGLAPLVRTYASADSFKNEHQICYETGNAVRCWRAATNHEVDAGIYFPKTKIAVLVRFFLFRPLEGAVLSDDLSRLSCQYDVSGMHCQTNGIEHSLSSSVLARRLAEDLSDDLFYRWVFLENYPTDRFVTDVSNLFMIKKPSVVIDPSQYASTCAYADNTGGLISMDQKHGCNINSLPFVYCHEFAHLRQARDGTYCIGGNRSEPILDARAQAIYRLGNSSVASRNADMRVALALNMEIGADINGNIACLIMMDNDFTYCSIFDKNNEDEREAISAIHGGKAPSGGDTALDAFYHPTQKTRHEILDELGPKKKAVDEFFDMLETFPSTIK